ncbi:MAG: Tetratricopeptide repeat-containing protein [Chitinophagaceae bacterium]|nr:Tetratricopeptide repeat-containing protein [Chitinophagaceae bacterium]
MKKIFFSLLLYSLSANLLAQDFKADSLLKIIASSMNDGVRIDAMTDLFDSYESHSTDSNMFYARKVLEIGQQRKINSLESVGYAEVGYTFYRLDNKAKGYEYVLKGLKIAEPDNNPRVMGAMYLLLGNFKTGKAKIFDYKKAVALWQSAGDSKNYGLTNLAKAYIETGQFDSALICATMAYEAARRVKYDVVIPYILLELGQIHEGLKNPALSVTYYRLALDDAKAKHSNRLLRNAYLRLAGFYKNTGVADSNFFYSKNAYDISSSETISWVITPAYSLYEIYSKQNKIDSALKYLLTYTSAKDSLNTIQEVQKMQSLDFAEQLRQQEIVVAELKLKEERKQNIQYAAIAITLITFIILFLLLSRSIIVKTKFIEFFGVLGLLALFEFINLFIHPYLAHATNDSPVLMLLVLIAIGALLIPLHHKLEKWITKIMVEKNKKIRLEAAKKTIQQLEG